MSLLQSGTRVIERAVLAEDGGQVGVRRSNGGVQITWFCGAVRHFTPEDMRNAIAHVELLSPYPDVVVELTDSNGRRLWARVEGDALLADESPSLQGARTIPWAAMKKAMKKAAE